MMTMRNLASPLVLRQVLAENGFRFTKSLGQNFLVDENVLDSIISGAEINGESCVLEIGPGFGTLTQRLCMHAKKVVAVEIDSDVIPVLKESTANFENIRVINADIMKTDIAALISDEFGSQKVKVCANLPYYITTPIISSLIKPSLPISDITIMIQKEVAERLAASPGGKDYGALSVMVGYRAEPELITVVPPSAFMPQPKVESAVIRLNLRSTPPVDLISEKVFENVVKGAFALRRKTLVNSLVNGGTLGLSKDEIIKILSVAGIDGKRRGETLSMQEFAAIANEISRCGG